MLFVAACAGGRFAASADCAHAAARRRSRGRSEQALFCRVQQRGPPTPDDDPSWENCFLRLASASPSSSSSSRAQGAQVLRFAIRRLSLSGLFCARPRLRVHLARGLIRRAARADGATLRSVRRVCLWVEDYNILGRGEKRRTLLRCVVGKWLWFVITEIRSWNNKKSACNGETRSQLADQDPRPNVWIHCNAHVIFSVSVLNP